MSARVRLVPCVVVLVASGGGAALADEPTKDPAPLCIATCVKADEDCEKRRIRDGGLYLVSCTYEHQACYAACAKPRGTDP